MSPRGSFSRSAASSMSGGAEQQQPTNNVCDPAKSTNDLRGLLATLVTVVVLFQIRTLLDMPYPSSSSSSPPPPYGYYDPSNRELYQFASLVSEQRRSRNSTTATAAAAPAVAMSPISPNYALPRVVVVHPSHPPTTGRSDSVNNNNNNNGQLVVFVFSRNDDFERRQIIRKTWAKNCDNVYFVVGEFCKLPPHTRALDEGGNQLCQARHAVLDRRFSADVWEYLRTAVRPNQIRLHDEQETHHDLLVTDVEDVYRNLPRKLKAAYTFVDRHLPSNVQWVLKVDDDMFVRPHMFQRYLDKQARRKPGGNVIINASFPTVLGHIQGNAFAHRRDSKSKWAEVVEYPSGGLYPKFPIGSAGHVVSRPVAEYVSKYQDALFEYQGEDVSLGIWLAAAGRHRGGGGGGGVGVPDPPEASASGRLFGRGPVVTVLDVRFLTSTVMKEEGDCRNKFLFVLGHDFNETSLTQCQAYWDGRRGHNAETTTTTTAAKKGQQSRRQVEGTGGNTPGRTQ